MMMIFFNFERDVLNQKTSDHLLSRSFKRRLKKGYLPYWESKYRFYGFGISITIRCKKYLMLPMIVLEILLLWFKRVLNILGAISPTIFSSMRANEYIILIELLRSGVLLKRDLIDMSDFELGAEVRAEMIKRIETSLNLFIYDQDFELLVKYPRAFFKFFFWPFSGQYLHLNSSLAPPKWVRKEDQDFIIPQF